ncbi:hypothetical protein [Paraburkholderia sp. HD33-4]|uniref:hypothetical protein n=1 Tax=Paraburkholderia sp. HD33-4 TaxID=2883242 RepID=UPI001F320F5D|nr:hypothetical protein [Paraburkholderia sp. HD33-4]
MSAGLSAAAIGGIAAGVGSVAGAVISSSGAKSAANTQAAGQDAAAQVQQNMFNTINGQEQPFIGIGNGAAGALNNLLGLTNGAGPGGLPNGYLNQTMGQFSFDPSTMANSPAYQFAQSQGLQQVQNAAAPAVGALSGAALKDLTSFATGTAEQYYNNYYNMAQNQYETNLNSLQSQQNNIFSRLSGIAGLGQNAASQVGTAGTQLGTGMAQATAGAAASQAAGTVGSANALSSGLSGAGNTLGSYLTLGNMLSNTNNNSTDYGVPGWSPASGGS